MLRAVGVFLPSRLHNHSFQKHVLLTPRTQPDQFPPSPCLRGAHAWSAHLLHHEHSTVCAPRHRAHICTTLVTSHITVRHCFRIRGASYDHHACPQCQERVQGTYARQLDHRIAQAVGYGCHVVLPQHATSPTVSTPAADATWSTWLRVKMTQPLARAPSVVLPEQYVDIDVMEVWLINQ